MKGVWTCTGSCARKIKSDAKPDEYCDCPTRRGAVGWLCCKGINGAGSCPPGTCFVCDGDRKFLLAAA